MRGSAPAGRARRHWPWWLLAAAFVVVPLVELAVVLQVRNAIGLGPTLVLLLAVSVLGAAVVRREGARAWRAFRQAVAAGRPPATEVADGAMLLVGGTLLLTPGFVTDVVGLVLVLPPSRALLRRRVTAFVARRLLVRTLGVDPRAGGRNRAGAPPRQRGPGAGPGPGAGGPGIWGPGAGGPGVGGRVADGSVVEGEVVDRARRPPGEE